MARFTAIPDVPIGIGNDPVVQLVDALKQNVELLMGLRGEVDQQSQAVLRGNVQVAALDAPYFSALDDLTVEGQGYTISGVTVPSLDDYAKLIGDVIMLRNNFVRLAQDVIILRNALNALTAQLRGG